MYQQTKTQITFKITFTKVKETTLKITLKFKFEGYFKLKLQFYQ